MLFSMMFQTLYFLADLYWMGRLGRRRSPLSASPAT